MASISLLRLILVYVAVRAFSSSGLLDLSRSGKSVHLVKLLRLLVVSRDKKCGSKLCVESKKM